MRVNVSEVLQKIHEQEDPIVQAELIDKAVHAGIKVVEIANELDTSSTYISHLRRLKKLPEVIINGFYDKVISLSHLFILSRLREHMEMTEMYEQVLSQNLSASKTERKVFELLSEKKIIGHKLSKEWVTSFKEEFTKLHPSIAVSVAQTRSRGEIVISFKGTFEQTTVVFDRIKAAIETDS